MYVSAVLFFYFASIGCLTPFLTSHMRYLGFSLTEISFINAVSAFFSLIGPMLFGTFAERRSRYKSTTVFCIFVGALAYIAISFVPRFDKLNYRPLVDFDCTAGLRVERCVNWVTCSEALDVGDNLTKVKLSDCHYQCAKSGHFTPTYPLHICFQGDNGNMCVVYDEERNDTSLTEFESQLMAWRFEEIAADPNHTTVLTGSSDVIDVIPDDNEEDVPRAHVSMCNFKPTGPINFGGKHYDTITCRPKVAECSIHCKVSFLSNGVSVHPRSCEEAFGNPNTTFWVYLVLRSIGDLCLLTTICLLDAITIWSTIDYEGAYGRIHVWAALGMAALAPLSGTLLDLHSGMHGRADFSLCAYLAAAFSMISITLIVIWPIHRQKSSHFQQALTPTKEVKFCSFEMVIFLAIIIILGTQWSVMYTFLPWLTEDIGCSFMLIGLGVTLMFGFSVPFLLISKNMIRNIGKANLLVFSMLFYFTRFAGVTFVTNRWWTLPFALMGSFTLCMMWIAAVAYGQILAPPGYSLIMQYLLNMLHFGIGRGIGSLLGGTLISSYSQRVVFCGIAVFSAVLAFLYLTVYHLGLRRRKKGTYPTLLNGTWYPLRERYPNGDAKAHQPIVVDQDDDIESSPSQSPNGKGK